ncbi:unnamed protein product [Paramecium pentaurelia]|uniref:Uncharacterized protein n=1 Tax=Paramecium pentaurelia TaxID=43138 RepID=A0A8S1XPT8_9CILI|nr:unnamed protein product [Paramecium pentaurelia]
MYIRVKRNNVIAKDYRVISMPNTQSNDLSQVSSIQIRGCGCCGTKQVYSDSRYRNQQYEENFATKLQTFTNIIVEKSLSFQDKMNQDEVLTAFQWFYNNKEKFQILRNEESLNTTNYQTYRKNCRIINEITTYIYQTFRFSILFIALNLLKKEIFRIYLRNRIANISRSNQYFAQLGGIRTINDQNLGSSLQDKLLKRKGVSYIYYVRFAFTQLKPSDEVISSVVEGGKFLLLNLYDKQIQNPLQILEIYYYFENLKWSILNQLKLGQSIQNIIKQITDGYSKYIKQSKDWIIHYCWVNMISDLMCYRPIVYKDQLLQTLQSGTSVQDSWNQLITSNQVIQLPYNKQAGRLKIFVNQNFIFKKFATLKLFQEYIKIMIDIQSSNTDQLNYEDILIQLITKQSNIELINALIKQLRSKKEELLNNFEVVKQQLSQHYSYLQTDKPIEINIIRQEIMFFMNQIKKQNLILLCLINEINQLVNNELQVNQIFQIILQGHQQNQGEQLKILKQQILTCIEYHDFGYKFRSLEFEKLLEPQLNQNSLIFTSNNNNLDKFLIQVSSIKRTFLKILEQKEFKIVIKVSISQFSLASQIIRLYNPQLILKLIQEIHQYYQNMFKEKLQIEQVSDVQKILIMIQSNLNIYKGLKMLHHGKLLQMSSKFQGMLANLSTIENEIQIYNQTNINEYIKKQLLIRKRSFIQQMNQLILICISNLISKEINEIKNKDWLDKIKFHHKVLLSEILTKLQLIDKKIIQQDIIKLLDEHLLEMNSNIQTDMVSSQVKNIQQMNLEKSLMKLRQNHLFDCESSTKILDNQQLFHKSQNQYSNKILIIISPKIKKQYYSFLISLKVHIHKAQIKQQLIYNNQHYNFFNPFIIRNKLFLRRIFVKTSKITQNTLNTCHDINTQLQYTYSRMKNLIILQNIIIELKKGNRFNQEKGIIDIFENSSYKVRELLLFNLIKMQSIIQEQTIQEFCEKQLQQIWIIEKHPSVRNLLTK